MLWIFKCLKGLGLKCPHCGKGKLTRNFWGAVEVCPECGYTFLGQPGDFWGGVVLTYAFAGATAITTAALLIINDMGSTNLMTFISVGVVIAASLLYFPFFRAIWIHLIYQGRGHDGK